MRHPRPSSDARAGRDDIPVVAAISRLNHTASRWPGCSRVQRRLRRCPSPDRLASHAIRGSPAGVDRCLQQSALRVPFERLHCGGRSLPINSAQAPERSTCPPLLTANNRATQRAMGGEDFSTVEGLRVRMVLHSGNTDERDGDYFGPTVNRASSAAASASSARGKAVQNASPIVLKMYAPCASIAARINIS